VKKCVTGVFFLPIFLSMVHFTRLPCAPPHLKRGGGGVFKVVSAGGVMPNKVENSKPVAKNFNVFMVNRSLDFL
jgi:hypothetical protein